jgi:hypothetical protein
MKKLALTIAIVLGLSMTTFANPDGGGLFQRGEVSPEANAIYGNRNGNTPLLPGHNLSENQDADPTTPLGSGIAVLMSLGAAYLVGKKRREE